MGLFDKKFCDICGEKIGLLGNRKLEDGNLCKNCARKLSPFMNDRRHSTVNEIKDHLAYREENERNLANFCPTKVISGTRYKVYIDTSAKKFVINTGSDFRAGNPDIIEISQVLACDVNIEEHKDEIYRETADGGRESYIPKRYEYEYEFSISISVNSPWFNEINFELSDGNRPESRTSLTYRALEQQAFELKAILTNQTIPPVTTNEQPDRIPDSERYSHGLHSGGQYVSRQQTLNQNNQNQGFQNNQVNNNVSTTWICQSCGMQNNSNFCQGCGSPKPSFGFRCDKCGYEVPAGSNPPAFCPNCGDPFDANDRR